MISVPDLGPWAESTIQDGLLGRHHVFQEQERSEE